MLCNVTLSRTFSFSFRLLFSLSCWHTYYSLGIRLRSCNAFAHKKWLANAIWSVSDCSFVKIHTVVGSHYTATVRGGEGFWNCSCPSSVLCGSRHSSVQFKFKYRLRLVWPCLIRSFFCIKRKKALNCRIHQISDLKLVLCKRQSLRLDNMSNAEMYAHIFLFDHHFCSFLRETSCVLMHLPTDCIACCCYAPQHLKWRSIQCASCLRGHITCCLFVFLSPVCCNRCNKFHSLRPVSHEWSDNECDVMSLCMPCCWIDLKSKAKDFPSCTMLLAAVMIE